MWGFKVMVQSGYLKSMKVFYASRQNNEVIRIVSHRTQSLQIGISFGSL